VATDIHYPIADTQQPAFAGTRAGEALPVTLDACASVLSLPCYPGMPDGDVAMVVRAVRGYFEGGRA
jgi:dTDP-4-amino-4,6-dideoxygalactose transaminase